MLAAQLLDENSPKRLEWLGGAILGWPDWDVDAGKEHPLAQLLPYNGYDAGATMALAILLRAAAPRASRCLEAYYEQVDDAHGA